MIKLRSFTLLLFLYAAHIGYGHDIKMAIFEMSRHGDNYVLEVIFDRGDFEKSVLTSYPTIEFAEGSEVKEQSVTNYLMNNLQLHINSQCQEMSIEEIDYSEESIRISIVLAHQGKVKQIDVINTCLIDYNPGHRNIFKINLDEKVRAFNLNAERISTSIIYKK